MQHVTKPKASASLNHILVQDNSLSQWTLITDKTILRDCLRQRNQQHYNQAYGMLFTVAPCSTTLNISNEQSDWTNLDTPDTHRKIDQAANLIAANLSNPIPKFLEVVEATDLCAGINIWRKATSTLPSGCHLGLYKSILLV